MKRNWGLKVHVGTRRLRSLRLKVRGTVWESLRKGVANYCGVYKSPASLETSIDFCVYTYV